MVNLKKRARKIATVDKLRNSIKDFVKRLGRRSDGCEVGRVSYYTREEWTEKEAGGPGESFGGELVLVIEDSPLLYYTLNYDEHLKILVKFQTLLARLGYWYDIGFSWSVHIYRDE